MKQSNFERKKEARRERAIKRQQRYDSLTIEQKLFQITRRPGESRKEYDRLTIALSEDNR